MQSSMSEFSELAKLGAAAPTCFHEFHHRCARRTNGRRKALGNFSAPTGSSDKMETFRCAGALYSDSPSAAAFTRRSRAASASVSIKVRLSSQPMQASVML